MPTRAVRSGALAGVRGRIARFRATRFWRWARWPVGAGLAAGFLGFVAIAFLYASVELPADPPELESSVIVDAQGRPLAALQKDGLRVHVDLEDVDPVVVQALIAAEDRGFRDHGGIDPRGLLRALKNNLAGGSTQGGSTITQQLVKNTYLTSERTYSRKVEEALLAVKLDRQSDKDDILERYLNIVYFGRGAYGIQAAADVYFDTTAAELTVPQASLLIGLLRAPESSDPARDPEVAKRRRDSVITALVEVGDLTAAEGREARASELGAQPVKPSVTLSADVGAHVVEWIRAQAVERFGAEVVYGGGLTIHSTIDLDHQAAAEASVREAVGQPGDPQAALVSVDADGAIRAHVGGRSYEELNVDLARGADGGGSGRQPGSTFKPIALAAALEGDAITLASRYPAPPQLTLDTPQGPWDVSNSGGADYGTVDLTTATAKSINTVYAQLMVEVTPEAVVSLAGGLGITDELQPDPALVLGTGEVSVVDLASVYSTFARDGERITPYVIERVEDRDGNEVFAADTSRARAIDAGTARGVTHALRQVIAGGTGRRADIGRPAAGKTGTTQSNGDAWFAGYTPTLTAAVWMGYPEGPQRTMTDVRGEAVNGGTLPAEIWQRYMAKVLEGSEPVDFAPPPPELLRLPELPATSVVLAPTSGPPGTRIDVTGEGYEQCVAGWFTTLTPGDVTSVTETGSTEPTRAAVLVVPLDQTEASATVTVHCDRGDGPKPVAQAPFAVDVVAPTTTSTSSTTTSTSSPPTTAPPTSAPVAPTAPASTTTAPAAAPGDRSTAPGGGGTPPG